MITLSHADAHWARQLLDWVLPRAESDTLETKRVSGKMVAKALGWIKTCSSLFSFGASSARSALCVYYLPPRITTRTASLSD